MNEKLKLDFGGPHDEAQLRAELCYHLNEAYYWLEQLNGADEDAKLAEECEHMAGLIGLICKQEGDDDSRKH